MLVRFLNLNHGHILQINFKWVSVDVPLSLSPRAASC